MQRPALTRTTSVMNSEPVKKTAESVLKSIPDSNLRLKNMINLLTRYGDSLKTLLKRFKLLPVMKFYLVNLNILQVVINLFVFSTIKVIRCLPNIWRCNW